MGVFYNKIPEHVNNFKKEGATLTSTRGFTWVVLFFN